MASYEGFTESLAAKWIKQEVLSRQEHPATNSFEAGRLAAILTTAQLFGSEHFDKPTQTALAHLTNQQETFNLLNRMFAAMLLQLKDKMTELSEEDLGYLHGMVGCVRLFNFIGVPEEIDQQAKQLAENPILQEFEKRFDWNTRTLNS